MKIIGHESIRSFFERCITEGSLSHAYCFVGAPHVGKRTVAEELARKIFAFDAVRPLVHPDFFLIEREINEKTGVLKKDISIEQIRGLTERFLQSSFVAHGYSIAIIDGAEHLSLSASNALLKTLEEPRTKKILILISEDEFSLLPTIRSRCQTIYFPLVPVQTIEAGLCDQGVEPARAAEFAEGSHGIPGLACTWAHDPEAYESYRLEQERFVSLIHKNIHERIMAIENLFEDKDDHIVGRAKILEILTIWTFTLRDMLVGKRDAERAFATTIPQFVNRLNDAKKNIGKNIHPRLILEDLMLHIS